MTLFDLAFVPLCPGSLATRAVGGVQVRRRRSTARLRRGVAWLVLFRYIEGWYNPHRRHSALGQRSALAFEHLHAVPSRGA